MEASQRVGGWGDIPPVSPSMLHPERRKRLGSISTGDYTAEVNAISQTQIVRGSDRSEQKEVSPLSDAAGWIVVAAGNWRWSGELFTSSHSILTHTHTHRRHHLECSSLLHCIGAYRPLRQPDIHTPHWQKVGFLCLSYLAILCSLAVPAGRRDPWHTPTPRRHPSSASLLFSSPSSTLADVTTVSLAPVAVCECCALLW